MLLGGVTFSSTFMMSRSIRQSSGLRLVDMITAVSPVQRRLMKIACGRARAVDGSDARATTWIIIFLCLKGLKFNT